jgi:hypothetical protein
MGDEADESNQTCLTAECLAILVESSRGVKVSIGINLSQGGNFERRRCSRQRTLKQFQFFVGIARLPRKSP